MTSYLGRQTLHPCHFRSEAVFDQGDGLTESGSRLSSAILPCQKYYIVSSLWTAFGISISHLFLPYRLNCK